MEDSILDCVKKKLGLAKAYTAFDSDVITFINSTFTILAQLGIGPAEGFMIEDETSKWEEFNAPTNQLNAVKTYMYLKVRQLFDPPSTSFHIDAVAKQIQEFEWRLNVLREDANAEVSS